MAYLVDHPPRRSQYRSPRRSQPTGAIVVHTAETRLRAGAALAVARFIVGRADVGSYHVLVDIIEALLLVELDDEAFHDGTGGNRWSYGLSFAAIAADWASYARADVDAAIELGALAAVEMAEHCEARTGIAIPARRITPAQYRAGHAGFISHAELDPTRRSDPGRDFPWHAFLTRYAELRGVEPPNNGDNNMAYCLPDNREAVIKASQQALVDAGYDLGSSGPAGDGVDGDWYNASHRGVVNAVNDRDLASADVRRLSEQLIAAHAERDQARTELLAANEHVTELEALHEQARTELVATRQELAAARTDLAQAVADGERWAEHAGELARLRDELTAELTRLRVVVGERDEQLTALLVEHETTLDALREANHSLAECQVALDLTARELAQCRAAGGDDVDELRAQIADLEFALLAATERATQLTADVTACQNRMRENEPMVKLGKVAATVLESEEALRDLWAQMHSDGVTETVRGSADPGPV